MVNVATPANIGHYQHLHGNNFRVMARSQVNEKSKSCTRHVHIETPTLAGYNALNLVKILTLR